MLKKFLRMAADNGIANVDRELQNLLKEYLPEISFDVNNDFAFCNEATNVFELFERFNVDRENVGSVKKIYNVIVHPMDEEDGKFLTITVDEEIIDSYVSINVILLPSYWTGRRNFVSEVDYGRQDKEENHNCLQELKPVKSFLEDCTAIEENQLGIRYVDFIVDGNFRAVLDATQISFADDMAMNAEECDIVHLDNINDEDIVNFSTGPQNLQYDEHGRNGEWDRRGKKYGKTSKESSMDGELSKRIFDIINTEKNKESILRKTLLQGFVGESKNLMEKKKKKKGNPLYRDSYRIRKRRFEKSQEKRQKNKPSTKEKVKDTGDYNCAHCERHYTRRKYLLDHIVRVHRGDQFQCDICEKLFKTKNNVREHIIKHITREARFRCKICRKKFRRAYYLTEHMRIHTGRRPYSCSMCKKKFRYLKDKREHDLTHQDKKQICDICGIMIVRRRDMMRHKKSHKEVKRYACPYCDENFSRLDYLKRIHMKMQHKCMDTECPITVILTGDM